MNSILDGLGTSQKIKALMSTRGITQNELAIVLGVSLGTIQNRFEHGRWTGTEVQKIAERYQIFLSDLI